jgi:hypothetical protein
MSSINAGIKSKNAKDLKTVNNRCFALSIRFGRSKGVVENDYRIISYI